MQVTHENEHVTHAVLGGGKTINFGISDSPAFFNILSSTLYKDQILAVVREVLCNANDAHIEAGLMDKPVEITLTEDKFIIRDFGKGIHKDDMGPIYATYGNSTKKNDGTQTGGFGLGCKAPFAYTDHFEVISSHDNVRTIYNLSKSSAQAQGKPGIVPIASFPTTETGLQVSINIKNRIDYNRFKELIHTIISNGDMNMTVNGNVIPTIGFDTSISDYTITEHNQFIQPILVRYGNVIYPVDVSNEIAFNYKKIVDFLTMIKGNNYGSMRKIIFQAPPHSIAVTPSRESLSMQEHTVKTLNTLFENFLNKVSKNFNQKIITIVHTVIDESVKSKEISKLLNTENKLPNSLSRVESKLTDLQSMAEFYLSSNYPKDLEFKKDDISYRLNEMSKAGLINRGKTSAFIKEVRKTTGFRGNTTWLKKKIIKPLLVKLIEAKIDHKQLYIYDQDDQNSLSHYRDGKYYSQVGATRCHPKSIFNCLPYLRNIIVITTARLNLYERVKQHEVFKELGTQQGFLFYHVSKKHKEKENVLAFFKAQGMVIVDLTVKQAWEVSDPVQRDPSKPRKPTKTGIVSLNAIKDSHGQIDTHLAKADDAIRINNPEFIVEISTNRDTSKLSIYNLTGVTTSLILKLFGGKGGISFNSATYINWLGKGAKSFHEFMDAKVSEYIKDNPRIKEYWAFKYSRIINSSPYEIRSKSDSIELIYVNKELRDHYKLINNLTSEDIEYITIFEELCPGHYPIKKYPLLSVIRDELNAIPIDALNTKVITEFLSNPIIKVVNINTLINSINDAKTDQQVKDKMKIIFDLVIKP